MRIIDADGHVQEKQIPWGDLLDEPFRAMDALTKGVAQEFLLQAYDRVRKTVFFITHDLEEKFAALKL